MASTSSLSSFSSHAADDGDEERRRNNHRLVMLDIDASKTTTAASVGVAEEVLSVGRGRVQTKKFEEVEEQEALLLLLPSTTTTSSPPGSGCSSSSSTTTRRTVGDLAKPCCGLCFSFLSNHLYDYFNNKKSTNRQLLLPHHNNRNMKKSKPSSWRTGFGLFGNNNDELYDHQEKSEEIRLFKYHEVPDFVKINPHILYGYRSLLPLHLCLKSIFIWSNETINIWSHLLGCLLFIVLLPYDNLYTIPQKSGTLSDHIVCSVSLICFQICMISSAGYHVFYCHSPQANVRWLAFDLSGIVVGLLGCYIPGVHYAFYCLSGWENIYLFTIIVLSLVILTIQLNPKRLSDSIAFTISRVLMYTFLACYGLIPTTHWFFINGGWKTEIVRVFIPKLISMYMIGLGAIFFYLFHFPERLSPGYFDIVGASHQIWHIFIFLSLVWWRSSYLEVLEYRTANICK